MWSLAALVIGFCIDLLVGDPHGFPHPVVLIGKCISVLERGLRCICPKTPSGERAAGAILWGAVVIVSTAVPALLLWLSGLVSPWLRLALESVMCWQILAVKSLRDESMKVYDALESGDLAASRHAVSVIVGRDTDRLDDAAVTRAAVETVAENTSDGVVAPLLFLAIGGAPLGFFYKAVNTMDSMLGYVEPPYKNIGLVPARADDVVNYIPARLSALLMLTAGGLMGLDTAAGWRIFRRDRRKHASPNSAQTESVCAGLLGLRLAGDVLVGDLPRCVADILLFVQHAVVPRIARKAHIQKARADRLRLRGVRARVLVAVAAEYLPAVFHVHAQKSARREHQQCRDARRQIVRNIIRLRRHKADVLIRRLDVAEH